MKTSFSWLGRNSRQRHLYRKGLLIILLVTFVPILFIGIAVNWIGTKQIEREVIGTHQKQVKQASERINDDLSHLENTATQWAFTPIFGANIRRLGQFYDYEMILDIYKTLLLLKGTNLLIDQVQLYLDQPGKLLSEAGGVVDLGEGEEKSRLRALLQRKETTYWLPAFAKAGSQETQKPPALIYKLPPDTSDPYAVLIIYLKVDVLTKMIEELVPYEKGGSLLKEATGQIIVSVNSNADLQSKLNEVLLNNAPGDINEASLRTEIITHNKEKYSVMSGNFQRLGSTWQYATASSMSNLLIPVVIVSRIIYGISLCALLIAVILSLFASKTLYQPILHVLRLFRDPKDDMLADEGYVHYESSNEIQYIERQWASLTKESESLRQRQQQQLPSLREGFLLQHMQGHLYHLSEEDLRSRMFQLGWDTEGTAFAIMVVRMHDSSSLNSRFQEGDEQLITFAMANISYEVSTRRFQQTEVINFQDQSVGLLIMYPLAELLTGQIKFALFQFAEELVHELEALLKMKLTVSIGRSTSSIREVPDLLQEALHAQKFRNADEANQILDVADYAPQGEEKVNYPFHTEADLIQSLRAGQEAEASRLLDLFCSELEKDAGNAYRFQQGLLQLLGNIQNTFIKSGYPLLECKEEANFFEQLSQIRVRTEAAKWFEAKIMIPYMEEVRKTSDAQDQRIILLVGKVIETMDRTFSDGAISLESCADLYQMNPFTLSKMFKQVTGINFIDYLTNLRIHKAKELLVETNLKISEIAEQVGYQTTYFNRIFKKHEYITPSQYRETYQQQA